MALHFRLAALVVIALSLSANIAQAADTLFVIRNADSSVIFPVTEDTVKSVGTHKMKAVLPASDGEVMDVEGPLMRDVIAASGLTGTHAMARALDNYEIEVPAADYNKYDVLLVTTISGKRLSVRDKGPAWVIYPNVEHTELRDPVYDARSVWQIKELIIE